MADPRNNVESVVVPAGVTGTFTVLITGANINSDGVPNTGGALDQDFALVIYNVNTTPAFEVTMSQPIYVTGNTITATQFRPKNPGPSPVPIHLRIWLVVPTMGDVELLDVGSDGGFFLPGNFDQDLAPVPLMAVTGTSPPRGNWQWNTRLRNPATTSILYEETNPFLVQ